MKEMLKLIISHKKLLKALSDKIEQEQIEKDEDLEESLLS